MDQGHHACLHTTTHDVDIMPFMIHRSRLQEQACGRHRALPSHRATAWRSTSKCVCVSQTASKQHDEFSDISAKYWLAEVEMHPNRHRRP